MGNRCQQHFPLLFRYEVLMFDFIVWVISNIGLSIYHFAFAITHPSLWLDWTSGESLMR
ncbi:MAG: hypothetical protein ACI90Y_002448, partial [Polaromonas sp.]